MYTRVDGYFSLSLLFIEFFIFQRVPVNDRKTDDDK